jgi:hypothetical protein
MERGLCQKRILLIYSNERLLRSSPRCSQTTTTRTTKQQQQQEEEDLDSLDRNRESNITELTST